VVITRMRMVPGRVARVATHSGHTKATGAERQEPSQGVPLHRHGDRAVLSMAGMRVLVVWLGGQESSGSVGPPRGLPVPRVRW